MPMYTGHRHSSSLRAHTEPRLKPIRSGPFAGHAVALILRLLLSRCFYAYGFSILV